MQEGRDAINHHSALKYPRDGIPPPKIVGFRFERGGEGPVLETRGAGLDLVEEGERAGVAVVGRGLEGLGALVVDADDEGEEGGGAGEGGVQAVAVEDGEEVEEEEVGVGGGEGGVGGCGCGDDVDAVGGGGGEG